MRELMEFHEVADIFPMMEGDDFKGLVDDIRKNGLINSIETYQNKIIDGRNRYLACKEAGAEPRFKEWNGSGSLVDYVISLNLKRRQLSESQRGMVAAKVANYSRGGDRGNQYTGGKLPIGSLAVEEAAKMLNVGAMTAYRAKNTIKTGIPELVQAVEKGELKVFAAEQIAKLPQEEQRKVLEGEMPQPKLQVMPKQEKPKPVIGLAPKKITKKYLEELHNDILVSINNFSIEVGKYTTMKEVLQQLDYKPSRNISREIEWVQDWVRDMKAILPY
jgi:hypothetical protein